MKFTIYHGLTKPIVAVGTNQAHLLQFAEKYPGWHSAKENCRATQRALAGLMRRGCIELNSFGQFRFVYPRAEG